jgi:hypothetical protein
MRERPVSEEALRCIRRDLRRVSTPALRHHGKSKPQPGAAELAGDIVEQGERLRCQVAPCGDLFLPGQ